MTVQETITAQGRVAATTKETSMTQRSDAIREKLGYAFTRWTELKQQIYGFHQTGNDVAFLGAKVGDILGSCLECFDYCAKDIVEASVSGHTNHSHFPFSPQSLNNKPWSLLKQQNPASFGLLDSLVARIDSNAKFPGTAFSLGLLRENHRLVNDKKHNIINETRKRPNSTTLLTFSDGTVVEVSPIFDTFEPDWGADVDASTWTATHPDMKVEYVADFRLSANNWEVRRFCDRVIGATWRAIGEIYAAQFGETQESFDPRVITLPQEEKTRRAAIDNASPICFGLMDVRLLKDGDLVFHLGMDFHGEPRDGESYDPKLAKEMRDVFRSYLWPALAMRKFLAMLTSERLGKFESEGMPPRYENLGMDLSSDKLLVLSNGQEVKFNQMVFGIGTLFRHSDPDPAPPFSEEIGPMVNYLFTPSNARPA